VEHQTQQLNRKALFFRRYQPKQEMLTLLFLNCKIIEIAKTKTKIGVCDIIGKARKNDEKI
jgi:hypothetical protein